MGGYDEDVIIPLRMEVESTDKSGVRREINEIMKEYERLNKTLQSEDTSRGKAATSSIRNEVFATIAEIQRVKTNIGQLYGQLGQQNALKDITSQIEKSNTNITNLTEKQAVLEKQVVSARNRRNALAGKLKKIEEEILALEKAGQKGTDAYTAAIVKRANVRDVELRSAEAEWNAKKRDLATTKEMIKVEKQNLANLNDANSSEAKREAYLKNIEANEERIVRNIDKERDSINAVAQDTANRLRNTAATNFQLEKGLDAYENMVADEKAATAATEGRAHRIQRVNELVKTNQGLIKQTVQDLYKELPPEERKAALIADNEKLKSNERDLTAQIKEVERQLAELEAQRLANGEKDVSEQEEALGIVKDRLKTELNINKAQQARNKAVIDSIPDSSKADTAKAEAIQKQTTNFYYLLRATKMLSEQFNRVSKNANNMFRGLMINGAKLLKLFGRLSLGVFGLVGAFKKTHKASNGFNMSLKDGIKNLLKYTLGIRSFFVLFNKLRHAMSEGMQALALQFPYVNKQMSSLLSSVVTMRNAIATAVQPLLRLLVPALKAVSNAAIEASYNIASFFATLTGQTFVYKAIRANEDYAASFDKASKSAKKAKQQLSGLEKLNVINSNQDSGAGSSGAAQVAEIATVADVMAKKVKKIFKDIFKPIKKAWNKEGKFVMDAWHFMLDECWTLIKHIGRDFMTMWKNDRGVKIWENILHIVGDVFEVVGWIAKRFREAWDEAEKGLAIFEGLQLLVDIVIQGIRDAMDATVEWAKQLDFNPLLSATIRWIYSLVKPTQTIVDILKDFWTTVILPFQKFSIEKGLPDLLDTLMRINHAVDWDGLKEKILAFNKALEPFLEKFWEALLIILEDIGNALADFVNSDAFNKFVDKIIEWMNNASPEDMAKGIEDLVKGLALLVVVFKGLSIAGGVAVQIGTITNAFMQLRNFIAKGGLVGVGQTIASLEDKVLGLPNIVWGAFTKVDGAIATFTSKAAERLLLFIMDPLAMFKYSLTSIPRAISTGLSTAAVNVETAIAGLETSVATGMANIEAALAGFNPLTGVLLIVGGLIAAFSAFFDMTANGFSALKEAIMLVGIALVTVGAIILGAPAAIAIAVASAVALLLTAIVLYRDGFFEKMAEFKQRVLEGIHNLGKTIGRVLGTIASKIINGVKDFGKNVINNIKKTFKGKSLPEIGMMIVKGVLWIFNAPARLMKFILEAVWNFFSGIVEGFNETFDINSPAKTMEPIGINIIKGVLAGITSIVSGIGKWIKSKIFDPFKKGLKDAFGIASGKAKELLADGRAMMEGVKSGAKEKWESVKTWFSGKWDTLKSDAATAAEKFKEVGENIVYSLKEGAGTVMDKLKSTGAWKKIFGEPEEEAKDVNQINSPSKVFKKIGNYMTEGLYEGVEENADDVTHAFDDIVPSTKSLDDLYTRFMKMFTNLRTDAVDSVGTMVDEIGSLLEKLDKIDATTAVMEQFKSIDIPKVAKGFTLPTNVSMTLAKQNDEKQQVDLSKLPDMLRDAFVEAILETDKDKKYNDDIVIEMNGKEIFRAMRRENEVWKKRHRGQTAFG